MDETLKDITKHLADDEGLWGTLEDSSMEFSELFNGNKEDFSYCIAELYLMKIKENPEDYINWLGILSIAMFQYHSLTHGKDQE